MHSSLVKNDTVIFVGAPNSGKTTLFNTLTGSHYKTTNYPGATVEFSEGKPQKEFHANFSVIDSPGIYSLSPKTDDEVVTHNLLFAKNTHQRCISIVVVVDPTHFSRQILVAQQLKDSGFPVILVLTMADILQEKSIAMDLPLLEEKIKIPLVALDSRSHEQMHQLVSLIQESFRHHDSSPHNIIDRRRSSLEIQQQFSFFEKIEKSIFRQIDSKSPTQALKNTTPNSHQSIHKIFSETSQKIDQWLLHPLWGLFIFFGIMTLLFASVFWLATPLMDLIDSLFSITIAQFQNLFPPSLLLDFVLNGLIAGIGAFMVFVPQIAILFFGLGLLEDSGYLSRAATLVDKPLSKLGMNGRSFVPILSAFACAIPAMMAARTIPNPREKKLTLFILPLMTCSARLPVYALMISFLVSKESLFWAGVLMAFLYFTSLILGGVVASVINRFLPKSSNSFFLLELPSYRRPMIRKILKNVYDRTQSFIFRAGPIILILSLIIWFMSNFPNYQIKDSKARFQTSYASQFGQVLEPLFKPMGGDWRVGLGLISSFAAREVFVSTMATLFNVSDPTEDNHTLIESMKSARFQTQNGTLGGYIFTVPSVAAILVFFMVALQCMATVSIARSEFGSWKMALIQLVSFNTLAYVLSVATYQTLKVFF